MMSSPLFGTPTAAQSPLVLGKRSIYGNRGTQLVRCIPNNHDNDYSSEVEMCEAEREGGNVEGAVIAGKCFPVAKLCGSYHDNGMEDT